MAVLSGFAHFVSWLFLAPFVAYMVVSLLMALYVFIFWDKYEAEICEPPMRVGEYVFLVAFINLWKWIFSVLCFLFCKYAIRYLHYRKWTSERVADLLHMHVWEIRNIILYPSILEWFPFLEIKEIND